MQDRRLHVGRLRENGPWVRRNAVRRVAILRNNEHATNRAQVARYSTLGDTTRNRNEKNWLHFVEMGPTDATDRGTWPGDLTINGYIDNYARF